MLSPLEVLRLYPEHDYTLAGAFERRASRDPGRPFILYGGKTWSWAGFGEGVTKTARLLAARGIGKGDRVGVLARNDIGHALLLFACARIGAIMVPSNPEFGVEEAFMVFMLESGRHPEPGTMVKYAPEFDSFRPERP